MLRPLVKKIVSETPFERPVHFILRQIYKTSSASAVSEYLVPKTFRSFGLPNGLTESDLRRIFLSFSLDDGPIGQLDPYVHDAFYRFIHTWELTQRETGKCLELGANPYFITWMLHEHTELDLTLANYFGGDEACGTQSLSWDDGESRRNISFNFDHFNMEESHFPYKNDTFDVVLYCEIIEHLLMNPVHALTEIHRVLKPGGLLVVTTPNVARLGNVVAMVEGRSIYDPYSGFGPYGRHNREFSMNELLHLLEFAGFEHEKSFTADAHHEDYSQHPKIAQISQLVADRPAHLGQYHFVAVRANNTPRKGFPGSLFRSYETSLIDHEW